MNPKVTPMLVSLRDRQLDIDSLVAALLTLPAWEKVSFILGDKVTWNQFLAMPEEARGRKFKITHDSLEFSKSKQVTELPSHQAVCGSLPRDMIQSMCAAVAILGDQCHCDMNAERTLKDHFPDTKTRKFKE